MTSPNKYDELFDSDEGNDRIEPITKPEAPIDNSELTVEDNLDAGNASEAIDSKDTTAEPAIESIDQIMIGIHNFKDKAAKLSETLTLCAAHRYKITPLLMRMFLVTEKQEPLSLEEERRLHIKLYNYFVDIGQLAKELAVWHRDTLEFYVDDYHDYVSLSYSSTELAKKKSIIKDSVISQRKILGEAAKDLKILETAMVACEKRMKKFRDDKYESISNAELLLISEDRETLTSGLGLDFDHDSYYLNLIDRSRLFFENVSPETSHQSMSRLKKNVLGEEE